MVNRRGGRGVCGCRHQLVTGTFSVTFWVAIIFFQQPPPPKKNTDPMHEIEACLLAITFFSFSFLLQLFSYPSPRTRFLHSPPILHIPHPPLSTPHPTPAHTIALPVLSLARSLTRSHCFCFVFFLNGGPPLLSLWHLVVTVAAASPLRSRWHSIPSLGRRLCACA